MIRSSNQTHQVDMGLGCLCMPKQLSEAAPSLAEKRKEMELCSPIDMYHIRNSLCSLYHISMYHEAAECVVEWSACWRLEATKTIRPVEMPGASSGGLILRRHNAISCTSELSKGNNRYYACTNSSRPRSISIAYGDRADQLPPRNHVSSGLLLLGAHHGPVQSCRSRQGYHPLKEKYCVSEIGLKNAHREP